MIDFGVEWEEAPGIRDQVLARTWAKLTITIDDHVVTRLVDARTNNLRSGVYGSVFPLAEWVVENWWFLLHESRRTVNGPGGRRAGVTASSREWVRRHSLLTAREGGSLPDLTFYRDDDHVVASWFPDPGPLPTRPVRFIPEHHAPRMKPGDVEAAYVRLVEAVLDRLSDSRDDDTSRLVANWAAVLASSREEAEICSWAAALGLDPYDPSELTDDVIELFEGRLTSLVPALRDDLLDATTRASLSADIDWVEEATRGSVEPPPRSAIHDDALARLPRVAAGSAHTRGYRRARLVREVLLGLDRVSPLSELEATLAKILRLRSRDDISVSPDGRIDGLVWEAHEGGPLIVAPSVEPHTARFRLGRALHFWLFSGANLHPRLLTRTFTTSQRESRAFAAELLAPAEALRAHGLEGPVSEAEVNRVAEDYDVSPWVIAHQLENHKIGHVAYV
jgi:hypothetical protein